MKHSGSVPVLIQLTPSFVISMPGQNASEEYRCVVSAVIQHRWRTHTRTRVDQEGELFLADLLEETNQYPVGVCVCVCVCVCVSQFIGVCVCVCLKYINGCARVFCGFTSFRQIPTVCPPAH